MVMLFMKCTGNECVPDCIKCKKCKRTITYHFIENIVSFQILSSVAYVGTVAERGNIARTWLFIK